MRKEEFHSVQNSSTFSVVQKRRILIILCRLNSAKLGSLFLKYNIQKDKEQYLVDTIAQNAIDVDVVVGDKNKKWNEDDKTLLFNVIQTASELRFPHMNNYYFVLDSKLIEFSMSNFKVEFSDVELDELSDNIKKDESGRIEYNITNQLFVPFDEAELKEYLHNIKRKVKITADIKYRISKDCVGAGISIVVD